MPKTPATEPTVLTVDAYDAKFDEDEEELTIDLTDEDGKKVLVKMDSEQAEEFVMELYQLLGLDDRDDDDD